RRQFVAASQRADTFLGDDVVQDSRLDFEFMAVLARQHVDVRTNGLGVTGKAATGEYFCASLEMRHWRTPFQAATTSSSDARSTSSTLTQRSQASQSMYCRMAASTRCRRTFGSSASSSQHRRPCCSTYHP